MPSKPIRGARVLQRQGRATLLYALAALVLVEGGLRLGIGSCWPELRDPPFEIKAQRLAQLIARAPRPPVTVVMVGSSVTHNAFKAKDLEAFLARKLERPAVVVNMSSLGSGPLTELVWTHRLLNRGIRPDLVLIEVNPVLYNCPGLPGEAGCFPAAMLSKADLDVVERYSPDPNLRRTWEQERWLPAAYRHRLTILNYLQPTLVPCQDRITTWRGTTDDHFWTALAPRSPEDLRGVLGQMKARYAGELAQFAPGRSSMQALEDLLRLLHRQRIGAVLVLAPQGKMLRSLYAHEPLEAFVKRLTQLSREHDCGFLNAFDWLEEDQFGDSLHPTRQGAEVFSTRLGREVLLPALPPSARAQRDE
jgi:hypothetical protein